MKIHRLFVFDIVSQNCRQSVYDHLAPPVYNHVHGAVPDCPKYRNIVGVVMFVPDMTFPCGEGYFFILLAPSLVGTGLVACDLMSEAGPLTVLY